MTQNVFHRMARRFDHGLFVLLPRHLPAETEKKHENLNQNSREIFSAIFIYNVHFNVVFILSQQKNSSKNLSV